MLKVAIIGCGRIVEVGHAPAFTQLKDEAEVVAIADPSEERLKIIGDRLGVKPENRFRDHQKMLSSVCLDVVDLALPHFLHESITIDCAQAKVDIISEKPIATNLEEADNMLRAIEENGVKFCILHNYKYQRHTAEVLRLVKEGKIGKPFLARSEGFGGSHWPGISDYDPDWRTKSKRAGGGCLIDNGYHNLYLTREIMGRVKSVYARVGTYYHNIDVDDTALLLLEHESGGTSSIQVGWSVKAGGQRVNEFHGTKGSLFLGWNERPLALYENDKNEWSYPEPAQETDNSFALLFHEFFESLKNDTSPPVSGEEARRNLEIIMAAYESGRTGKPVEV